MNEELKIIITAATEPAQKAIKGVSKEIKNLTTAAKSSCSKFSNSVKTATKTAQKAFIGLIATIGSVIAALGMLGKSAINYQKGQAKLNAAFQSAGASAATAQKAYESLYRFLGDGDQAVEAAAHLAKLATSTESLTEWGKICQGVYATFGDSLPIESLTEAANESVRVGKATGVLADALNWAGVNEDEFNAKLARTTSFEEREALVRGTLSGLYEEAANIYEKNNQALIEYNESQSKFNRAIAAAGNACTPFLTALNNLGAAFFNALQPAIDAIMPYIVAFVNGITKAVAAVSSFFAALTGKKQTITTTGEGLSYAAGGAGNLSSNLGDATQAAEKLRKATQGFDELNIVPSDTTSNSGGGGTSSGGGSPSLGGGSFTTETTTEASEASTAFQEFLQPIKDALDKIDFSPLLTSLDNLWDSVSRFGGTFGESIRLFLVNIAIPLSEIVIEEALPAFFNILADAVDYANTKLSSFNTWFSTNWEGSIKPGLKEDFTPLANSLNSVWDSLSKFTETTGAGLKPIATEIIPSLVGVVISDTLPAFFNSVAAALNALQPHLESFGAWMNENWQKFQTWLNEQYTGLTTSLNDLFTAIMSYAEPCLTLLKALFEQALIPLGKFTIEYVIPEFLQVLTDALNVAQPYLDKFATWIRENPEKVKEIAKIIASFWLAWEGYKLLNDMGNIFTSVLGPFSKILEWCGNVGIVMGQVSAQYGPFKTIVALVITFFKDIVAWVGKISTIGAILIAVAATIKVLYDNWDTVVKVFKDFAEKIELEAKLQAIKDALAPLIGEGGKLAEIFNLIGEICTGVLAVAFSLVAGLFNSILTALPHAITALQGAIDIIVGLADIIVGIFTFDKEKILGGLSTLATGIADTLTGLVGTVLGLVGGMIRGVIDWFASLWDNIVPGPIKKFVDGVVGFFTDLWDTLVGHSIVPDTIEAIIEWFASLPKKIYDGLKNFVKGVIDFFKEMWKGVEDTWKGITDWFGNLFKATWEAIKNAWSGVKDWFGNIWDSIKQTFQNVDSWLTEKFGAAWTGIKTLYAPFVGYFKQLWESVKGIFSAVKSVLQGNFAEAWEAIKGVFSGWVSFFTNLWTNIKTIFANVGTAIGDAISNTVKTAINWVLSKAIGLINGFIRSINTAIGIINKIPGVNIGRLTELNVPKLAKGGIVDSATLAMVGERGKEAVVPLENNTEWMDKLADRIAAKQPAPSKIVLTLDGKELGWASIHSINNITKQTGSVQLSLA